MIILKITMRRINRQRQSEDSLVSMWNLHTLQKGFPATQFELASAFYTSHSKFKINFTRTFYLLVSLHIRRCFTFSACSMSQWEWNVNFFNNIYRTYLYTLWRCLNLFHLSLSLFPISRHHFAIRFLPSLKREMKFLIGVYSSVY